MPKQPIAVSDVEILDSFFRDLLETTAAGYVIYGNKPIYLGHFSQPEWLVPGSMAHKKAIAAFFSLKKLKDIARNSKGSKYELILRNIENSSSEKMELMLINRKALLKTVEENLILFKYKFGHSTTPNDLLELLHAQGFSRLFGKEIALQGIVLGYGANNSISYERIAPYAGMKHFPSSPLNSVPPPPKTEDEMIARLKKNAIEKHAWKEVKKEMDDISYYCPQNATDKLKIPFSFHQTTKETKMLFQNYAKSQAKLDRLLRCPSFLDQMFKDLGIARPSQGKITLTDEQNRLSKSLARSIQYSFQEQISPEFIEGMKAADEEDLDEHAMQFKEMEFLEILRQKNLSSNTCRENTNRTRQFFKKIAGDGNTCLVSNKLYYSILKEGSSKNSIHSNGARFKAHFLIKDILGNSISGTYQFEPSKLLSSEALIPGLAHGMIGMREGEIREIYIHPDFAYGVDSEFGNGSALQVQIELVEIQEQADGFELPSLQPFDVTNFAPDIETCKQFEALQKRYNYLCGMKTWYHYKQARSLLNFKEIVNGIQLEAQSFTELDKTLVSRLNSYIFYAAPRA